MSDSDDNYIGVLLEQIRDEVKAIHEVVSDHPNRAEFDSLRDDVRELKDDMKVVKAAVTDLGHQGNDHEHRITRLEPKRA